METLTNLTYKELRNAKIKPPPFKEPSLCKEVRQTDVFVAYVAEVGQEQHIQRSGKYSVILLPVRQLPPEH